MTNRENIQDFYHDHVCESCNVAWPHQAPRCDLPEEYPCIEHGGSFPEVHGHKCPTCQQHWGHGDRECTLLIEHSCPDHILTFDLSNQVPDTVSLIIEKGLGGLSDKEFELLLADLFRHRGYEVQVTGRTGDQGVDLFIAGIYTKSLEAVQCKHWKSQVGASAVRDFYGALVHFHAQKGYLVASAGVTQAAREWAADKPLEFIDNRMLAVWILSMFVSREVPSILEPLRKKLDDAKAEMLRRERAQPSRIIIP